MNARCLGLLTVVFLGQGTQAAQIHIPANSFLSIVQRDDPSLIEHLPLKNLITWEVFIRTGVCGSGQCVGGMDHGSACSMNTDCASQPLTFTGGTAEFFDEDGNSMLGPLPITPPLFEQVATEFPVDPPAAQITLVADGALIPANSNIALPFPIELLDINVVPATVDMALCFKEFENPPNVCSDPLEILGVKLVEYRVPPGQTYIHPLRNPALNPGGILFTGSGGGHEIGDNHRLAANQRYAYDVGVLVNGSDRKNVDNTNGDFYIYTEPILAVADGTVVVAGKDFPENPMVGVILPGAGKCNTQRCDGMSPPCTGNDFPGSGNQVVLLHDNGEFTTMAHMTTGSNNSLNCFDSVSQGDLIGGVGNVGTTSAPHIHYSSLNTPSPEDPGARSFPMYFTNVQFASPGFSPRRQLDVAMFSGTQFVILPPPTPLPSNVVTGPGVVPEMEPNDTLGSHHAISLGTTIQANLENADVGDLAVRGDGIEDVYRVDLASTEEVRLDLASPSVQNLDVYVLTEDLRVLNETHQGTSPGSMERVCVALDPGAYYVMVTNVDPTRTANAAYDLDVVSDPQTIDVAVTNVAQPIQVDESCQAEVEFQIDIHDNCCLDPDALNLLVSVTNPTHNATLGPVELDPLQVMSERDVRVTGRVTVSDLTSCPAEVKVTASASDCSGNVVSSADQNGDAVVLVEDSIAPDVDSSVALELLWPPNHDLVPVGFQRSATDNCDPQVEGSLTTTAFSDEPEEATADGHHAPDAADLDADLRLRRERSGTGDGRVYLLVSQATDACGNTAFACSVAGVPHSRSKSSLQALEQQLTAAKAFCESNAGASPPGFVPMGAAPAVGPKQ